ncbi:RNA-dependent RNA polymerase [Neofusicoccum parvum victorivirus 2]|uniref:RNA-directed RNA polymerase n=1 Tax=Neofusicoccum parvum victorivirus 2 TaxID=2818055 RepID=A0A8A5D6S6_9VIRU|nr:RNA-dependent RNA polymerase [Neofusicoccum parvum victorivirus 2]
MSGHSPSERARAAGSLGGYLLGLLPPRLAGVVSALPFERQISFVYSPFWLGRRPSTIQRLAGAFLLPAVPVQVPTTDADLLLLLRTIPPLPPPLPGRSFPPRWATVDRASLTAFPPKRNPAATNKVNVYLNEVVASVYDISEHWGAEAESALASLAGRGIFNDAAAAVVIYGTALASKGVPGGFGVAGNFVLDPELAKSWTTILKATGANSTPLGASLVEAQTLIGRDVAPADLQAEATYRTTDAVHESTTRYSDDVLREHIRYVLETEIQRREGSLIVDYPSLEDHWFRRWLWAVNGSQSGLLSREALERHPRPPGATREYRRAWLERVEQDPRPGWDGHTYVSASPKLEHGKTRTIFACDTLNYLAFEHILAPVEARWRGQRVILNPGKGGNVGMTFRTLAARSRAGISLMLDYDDFNSQHQTRAMQIIFEELGRLTGYPPGLLRPLVDSFDKCEIFLGATSYGYSKGTLMSGHRATTFINSILNYVYLRIELGSGFLDERPSLHVGDDVYLGVRTYKEAAHVIQKTRGSRLRMNPMKQSVGHQSTEFLRLACAGRATYGYLARSVASTISGNWVSEEALDPRDGLVTMLTNARSLANRGGSNVLPLLLRRSLRRISKLPRSDHSTLDRLLVGTMALDNGPMFSQGAEYISVQTYTVAPPPDTFGYRTLPLEASKTYLSRCAHPLEQQMLDEAGISVVGVMAEASYRKSFASDFSRTDRIVLGPVIRRPARGSEAVENLLNRRPPPGVLANFPLLRLARHRLSTQMLRRAIAVAGGNPDAIDLNYEAWGERSHGCIVATPLSYPDAASYGRLTEADVLTCGHSFYV